MKKIVILVICLSMLILITSGCVSINISSSGVGTGVVGKGEQETFTIDVGEINELNISILADIEYSTTMSDVVTITIQPNLIQYISFKESNGTLTISSTRGISWVPGITPVIKIGSPSLSKVIMAGAGSFKALDTITVDRFEFEFAGAGNVSADLDVGTVQITIAGAGDVRLSGRADNADFFLNGAGSIEALELQARVSNVFLAGAGSVRVNSTDFLKVNAAGVGSVEYIGSPELDITRGGLVSVRNISGR